MRVDYSIGFIWSQSVGLLMMDSLNALTHGVTDPKSLERGGRRSEFPVGEESEFSGVLGVFIAFVDARRHWHYFSADDHVPATIRYKNNIHSPKS